MALQSLYEADYDIPTAVEIIHDARREKLRLKREEAERIHKFAFEKAMDRHGKKFHFVKVNRSKYTNPPFQANASFDGMTLSSDDLREKKRKKEVKRQEQCRPAEDQHKEYCEKCFKGGKLLCCDGCERAYHLNCVRPALLDVPEGDWFCSHCRGVRPKTPSATKCETISAPVPSASKTSKLETQPHASSVRTNRKLPGSTHARSAEAKVDAIGRSKQKSNSSKDTPRQTNHEKSSSSDVVSDITTDSESDGGAAKVFQALTSNYIVTTPSRKRKQKFVQVEMGSRYSSPSRSLEYLSNPLQATRREILPLQVEKVSSQRKRKRQQDIHQRAPPSYSMGV
ncbi:unnamed protein product [Phytophthora lilii]|uniref:Unnamed protein product n=1 Tax=Phytophthora lilii TaxID=2077276 RepID=A0A9W7CN54_9STRA|nr:unnamed protein product [Phytophthora lilii]